MEELLQLLKSTKHKSVKIGAENGTGFFYVGSVDNFITNIERVDAACHMAADHRVRNCKTRMERLLKNCPTPGMFSARLLAKGRVNEITAEGYNSLLNEYFGKVRSLDEETKRAEELLEHYTTIELRTVVTCFEADPDVDEDCLVIIIEGWELGKYWMLEEAKEGEEVSFDMDSNLPSGIHKRVEERVA